jgi:katanin p60 ATPase-containing subunit A1
MSQQDILRLVDSARQHAQLGNYNESLRQYDRARVATDSELTSSRLPAEHAKWNTILTDIGTEMKTVRDVASTRSALFAAVGPERYDEPESPTDPDPVPVRMAPRPDVRAKRPPSDPKRRTPAKPAADPPRRAAVAPQPAVDPPRKAAPAQRPGAPAPAKVPKPAAAPAKGAKPEDPLVQQILEMGILVREPNVPWDSIAGLSDVKRLLRQNLVILPMRPDIAKGLLAPWKSVLFYGPPGTGKTFLAKAVATECKRTFFNITSATITSKWHGESEKLVADLFKLAGDMSPSTIFFDEIDSIASQRGGAHENEPSRRMKAQLLTCLEGIDSISDSASVFVIAATNFPWDLDEALLRRFQKRVYIPLPDVDGRVSILQKQLSEHTDSTFDFQHWGQQLEGYSCSDVSMLCRDAAQVSFNKMLEDMNTVQWQSVAGDAAKVVITNADFGAVKAKRQSSVDKESIAKYEKWRQEKGAD